MVNPIYPKTKSAVLQIANWQIGMVESPSGSNKVKYNTDFYGRVVSGSAYPWCMVFVWWVFREASFNLFKTASCSAFVARYKDKSPSQIVRDNFEPGDIVFFDFSGKKSKTEHVGIVVENIGSSVVTIEGNTGTGNDSNGGCVMRRTRSTKMITCAVRPGYPD